MSGFENLIATPEKEPRFPSLEEIKNQIERLSGRENIEVVRTCEDEKGIYLHEAIFVDEKGNSTLYSYSRVGSYKETKSVSTSIDEAYFEGKLEDGNFISGRVLAEYDEVSGEWKDKE